MHETLLMTNSGKQMKSKLENFQQMPACFTDAVIWMAFSFWRTVIPLLVKNVYQSLNQSSIIIYLLYRFNEKETKFLHKLIETR